MVSGDAGAVILGLARGPGHERAAKIATMTRLDVRRWIAVLLCAFGASVLLAGSTDAQVPPSREEIQAYTGLFAAAARGDASQIGALVAGGAQVDARDAHGRTPLHVAAFGRHAEAMRALVAAGADPNALEHDRYDIVTIAAVADDLPTLKAALALGASARNVTSRYDGTALIAAAHLGHAEVVGVLIAARAPLDHVNNLGWTALIESIVLGDGGARHTDTLRRLVEAGANVNLADREGRTPRTLARTRGYDAMVAILERAGAR
jgi:ankyrin repeat protein